MLVLPCLDTRNMPKEKWRAFIKKSKQNQLLSNPDQNLKHLYQNQKIPKWNSSVSIIEHYFDLIGNYYY
jgi:hypothetical protein